LYVDVCDCMVVLLDIMLVGAKAEIVVVVVVRGIKLVKGSMVRNIGVDVILNDVTKTVIHGRQMDNRASLSIRITLWQRCKETLNAQSIGMS